MDVVFIRHASSEPVGPEGDAARRLTEEGNSEMRATGQALRKLGIELNLVLTSPLVRAVQSAEIISEVHEGSKMAAADVLTPSKDFKVEPVSKKLRELLAQGLSAVALVGHAPSLDECIGELIAGTSQTGISLSKAGAACLTIPAENAPTTADLRWIMRREQLEMLVMDP